MGHALEQGRRWVLGEEMNHRGRVDRARRPLGLRRFHRGDGAGAGLSCKLIQTNSKLIHTVGLPSRAGRC